MNKKTIINYKQIPYKKDYIYFERVKHNNTLGFKWGNIKRRYMGFSYSYALRYFKSYITENLRLMKGGLK
jgi:hypothetical protein